MRTSIRWLWQHKQYLPARILLRLIMGLGISAISSKLHTMSNITVSKIKGKQQSVVFMKDDGSIDWPENPNSSGVLVVPCPFKNLHEWQAKHDK